MQPGEQIGRYTIVRQIGAGGMSVVYLAEDGEDGTQVVVKQLKDQYQFDAQFVDRFVRGAQIMRELRHPHLARVFDYIERDGQYFMVEEYLSGGSLADRLDRGEPYTEEEALVWCRDSLRAVNYAHENGIVHRDLKPGNLMLDEQGRVKVTDFGIARIFGGPRLTRTGDEMGTPVYMSPEQILSPGKVDHLTDVYAMGVTLYELLTGKLPFDGDSDFTIKEKIARQPPAPLGSLKAGVVPLNSRDTAIAPELKKIVLKAIEKQPGRRFAGCGEFALHLDRHMHPSAANPWLVWGRRIAAAVLLLALSFGIGAMVGGLWPVSSEESVTAQPEPEPTHVAMPNVVGQSLAEAQKALEAVDLKAGEVEERLEGDGAPGTVVDQSPDAGERVTIHITEGGGTTHQTVLLTIKKAPPDPFIDTLSVTSTRIKRGQSVRLAWKARHADSVVVRWSLDTAIRGLEPRGSRSFRPQRTTTYQVTPVGPDGRGKTRSVTVHVVRAGY